MNLDNLFDDLSKVTALTAAHQRIAELEAEVDRLTDELTKSNRKLSKARNTIRRMEEGDL